MAESIKDLFEIKEAVKKAKVVKTELYMRDDVINIPATKKVILEIIDELIESDEMVDQIEAIILSDRSVLITKQF